MDYPTNSDTAELKGISKREFFERKGYNWDDVEKILRINRTYKSMVNSQTDVHHIIATARGGSNMSINRKEINRGEHVTHHDYLGIRTPAEQISFVLDFNRKVFLPDIPNRIYDILDNASSKHKLYKPQSFNS